MIANSFTTALVAGLLAGLPAAEAKAADPSSTARQWQTDAREVRYIPFKQHKDMLAAHRKQYGQNAAMDAWMRRVDNGSATFSPGVRTIDPDRFQQSIVYGLILICDAPEQTKRYYIMPIQFDNSGLIPNYTANNFMCGAHL